MSGIPQGMELYMIGLAPRPPTAFRYIEPLDLLVQQEPVCNALYRCWAPGHPGPDADAAQVSWDDAKAFCRAMQERMAGRLPPQSALRLLQQAEWAGCAQCAPAGEPPWGELCPGFSRYALIEAMNLPHDGVDRVNAWGLHGLDNGLWEWVEDIYDPHMNRRILRGACWQGVVDGEARQLYFRTPHPERPMPQTGFRMAIGPPIPD